MQFILCHVALTTQSRCTRRGFLCAPRNRVKKVYTDLSSSYLHRLDLYVMQCTALAEGHVFLVGACREPRHLLHTYELDSLLTTPLQVHMLGCGQFHSSYSFHVSAQLIIECRNEWGLIFFPYSNQVYVPNHKNVVTVRTVYSVNNFTDASRLYNILHIIWEYSGPPYF